MGAKRSSEMDKWTHSGEEAVDWGGSLMGVVNEIKWCSLVNRIRI